MMLLEVLDLGNVKIGAACGIAPTLRTEREEWGTHFVGCVRVIERLGHPPTITYGVGPDGRATAAQDTTNTVNYVESAAYTPSGALKTMVNGQTTSFAGITVTNAYNSRLQ